MYFNVPLKHLKTLQYQWNNFFSAKTIYSVSQPWVHHRATCTIWAVISFPNSLGDCCPPDLSLASEVSWNRRRENCVRAETGHDGWCRFELAEVYPLIYTGLSRELCGSLGKVVWQEESICRWRHTQVLTSSILTSQLALCTHHLPPAHPVRPQDKRIEITQQILS